MISATVVADSISNEGKRITTMELVMPRLILAQFNTHRAFSRNAASSRAIPTERLIKEVLENPYVPTTFKANQKGMQPGDAEYVDQQVSKAVWLHARDCAVGSAYQLKGVHKQWVNRLLEPFMWTKVLVTATEWDNFFALRLHHDAQDEIQQLAAAMKEAMQKSAPFLAPKDVLYPHSPYCNDYSLPFRKRLIHSVARCARVSYNNFNGRPSTLEEDTALVKKLLSANPFHASPFEHVASPAPIGIFYKQSNFEKWTQLRHDTNMLQSFLG